MAGILYKNGRPQFEGMGEVLGRTAPPPLALRRIPSAAGALDGWNVCSRAADARARNSPAAAALQAQCDAFRAAGLTKGTASEEDGIPRNVLIAGGVVGALALAAVAYKLTR
ncbi:MAG: hypothetical protein WKG32_20900 [Gemmatimonadaceae bacterium]